jgi:hypothetical protein
MLQATQERRFYFNQRDFVLERGFYENETFRKCLPELVHFDDNAHGQVVSRNGYRFPPYLALDRGITLKGWLQVRRNPSTMLGMAVEVLELLMILHDSGYVHRDLKPENLLFVFHTQQWRLLDIGIATTAGVGSSTLCSTIAMLMTCHEGRPLV